MATNNETTKKTRSTYREPKFYLDKNNSDKPEAIFLKFSFANGKRISYFTGQRIKPDNWSKDNQRVKRNVTGGSEINDILNTLAEEASKSVREAKLTGTTLTNEKLKERLNIVIGNHAIKTNFFEIYDHFVSTESKLKSWTKGTLTKLTTIRTQLEAFEVDQRKTKKSYKIDLASIDDKFFQELITFWQLVYDLRNTTIQKNIHILRWFFNWCLQKKLISADYKNVKIDLKGTDKHKINKIIYLDLAEIGKLYRVEIPKEKQYLERTRDVFIFQCLTGLRFSDLYNLKASDYKNGIISVSTIKTGENIDVDLNETTESIWNKYSEYQAATGRALPVTVNQVYNKFLKELAKLAAINEKITLVHYQGAERKVKTYEKHELICSHTARRSFITNGLTVGIGAEVLKSWTGHKSEKSFEAYYEIVKEKKAADIKKFVI